MKRLQFRHHNEIFNTREKALQYFADIVNTEKKASDEFGESLYAEPMVAKYLDENNNEQIILAIGVDGGHKPYHIIDSKYIKELIIEEELRAENIEKLLEQSIKDEKSKYLF